MTADVTLSHSAARALYDRIGRWQDTQRFYEDCAIGALIAHADFEHARSVFEFGCGTGRIAERLLRDHLPPTARYYGIDISSTMVALAQQRTAPWGDRAAIAQSDGSPSIDAPDGGCDRFISTYVLDLLSVEDITRVLDGAHRLLSADGLLCVVSATQGHTPMQRAVMGLAGRLHALSPSLVGGCRAVNLLSHLRVERWNVVYQSVVSKWAIPSEVLVASPA